jgi:hypothetical protein
MQVDFASDRLYITYHTLQERRFSSPIWPNDCGQAALGNTAIYVYNCGDFSVTKTQVFE